MRGFWGLHGVGVFLAAVVLAGLAWGETLEMVTYYPAPSAGGGDFDRLHANRATIGEEYNRTNVPDADVPDGHLFVFDRVGIGTTDPVGPLHVVGADGAASSVVFMPGAGGTLNVGIGTTDPVLNALHIRSGLPSLNLQPTADTIARDIIFSNAAGTGTASVWQLSARPNPDVNPPDSADSFILANYPGGVFTPRLTVTTAGNLGIGTANPISVLHAVGGPDDTANNIMLDNYIDVANWGGEFVTRRSRGTPNAPAAVVDNDDLGGIAFSGYNGTSFVAGAGIGPQVDGAPNAGGVPTAVHIAVYDGTTYSQRLTVRANGRVGIGTTAPAYPLHIRDTDVGHTALMLDSTNPATWMALKNNTMTAPFPLIGCGSSGEVQIQTGGVGRFTITPNGRVGIAAGGPIAALEVRGAYNAAGGTGGTTQRTLLLQNSLPEDGNNRFMDCIRVGTGDSEFIIYNNGVVRSDGGFTSAADYAEWLETVDADLSPGELVSLDADHPNHVRRAKEPKDPWLFGVISTNPGVIGTRAEDVTEASEAREKDPRWKKVAFLGQVPTKVTGDVAVGDGITAASLAGVGMRAGPGDPVVAVALEPHQGDEPGLINCAVVPNGGRFQAGLLQKLEEQQARIQALERKLEEVLKR